jgi:endonuclease G
MNVITKPVDLAHRPMLASLRQLGGPVIAANVEGVFGLEAAPKISLPARFQGRTGYSADFLDGFSVPLPSPTGRKAGDVLPVEGSGGGRLDYQHFSVVMSKSRRIAMFVAVNIDGSQSKKIERDSDKWFLDGRIPLEAQIGEELYAGNLLDRGHLVRREDPNWGTAAIAGIANDDTFHFTNCSPQMGAFNQRTWLGMEDHILKNARAWKARVTVFTGPVFSDGDLDYRGTLIPRAYWKVIAFLSDDLKPSATAYLVSQAKELRDLEAAFGAYKTYQRSVRSIETMTGLSFGRLSEFDGFSNEEVATRTEIAAEIRDFGDMRV